MILMSLGCNYFVFMEGKECFPPLSKHNELNTFLLSVIKSHGWFLYIFVFSRIFSVHPRWSDCQGNRFLGVKMVVLVRKRESLNCRPRLDPYLTDVVTNGVQKVPTKQCPWI